MTSSASSAAATSDYDLALAYVTAPASSSSSPSLSNQAKLQFYALYKQITVGDCVGTIPSMFKPIERAKWDAWNKLKGTSAADAKKAYVECLDKTTPSWRSTSKALKSKL